MNLWKRVTSAFLSIVISCLAGCGGDDGQIGSSAAGGLSLSSGRRASTNATRVRNGLYDCMGHLGNLICIGSTATQ